MACLKSWVQSTVVTLKLTLHQETMKIQAIVDSNLNFLHASVGHPGSIHDARVLRLSGIYDQAQSEQIFSAPVRDLSGTKIRPLIAGDSAYPLTSWPIKSFQDRVNIPREERKFNTKLSAIRSVVERAFGMLKGRWRIVMKKIKQQVGTLNKTITAACVLRNVCIALNETYDLDENDSDDDDDDDDDDYDDDDDDDDVDDDDDDDDGGFQPASHMRNAMKNYVWNNL